MPFFLMVRVLPVKLTYSLAKAAPDGYSSIVYFVTGQAESELVNQVATSTTSVDASSGKAVYSYFSLELETMLISSLTQIHWHFPPGTALQSILVYYYEH
jgi:hypothetical protein